MKAPQRLIAALWFPWLPTERLERQDPSLSSRPLALYGDRAGQVILTAVNPLAAQAGLTPGMTLANARALLPPQQQPQGRPELTPKAGSESAPELGTGLILRPANMKADAAVLERLRAWCDRYTPWTAQDPERDGRDGLTLDITGCAHLFGGEIAMLRDMVEMLDGLGFSLRPAIAPTPLAAAALARFSDYNEDPPCILREDGLRAALAPLPVMALNPPPATLDGMRRVGLLRIQDLLPLPRSALAARYGLDLVNRLARIMGEAPDPISPRVFQKPYRVRMKFPDPIGLPEDLGHALRRLLERLSLRLEREQRGSRKLVLSAFRVDGDVCRLTVGAASAARDPNHLARLFAEKLSSIDPGFGIDTMVLEAQRLEDLGPKQQDQHSPPTTAQVPTSDPASGPTSNLAGSKHSPSRTAQNDAMDQLADRLASRLGEGALLRLHPINSHRPDEAQRLIPLYGKNSKATPRTSGKTAGKTQDIPAWQAGTAPRPAMILTPPDPLTITNVTMREGAWFRQFRWRGRDHSVRRMVGPERIAPEWWRHDLSNTQDRTASVEERDYYRVEDSTGALFWLYQDRRRPTYWYLHGVFA